MDLDAKILTRAPDPHLHSKTHLLADDLSRMLGEPERFASYLGLAVLYQESDLRALARRVLAKEDLPITARGKYFFAAVAGLRKKPGAHLKRARRRKKRTPNANGRNRKANRPRSGRNASKTRKTRRGR